MNAVVERIREVTPARRRAGMKLDGIRERAIYITKQRRERVGIKKYHIHKRMARSDKGIKREK